MIKCLVCDNKISTKNKFILENAPNSTFNFSDKTVDLHLIECDFCGAVQLVDIPLSQDYDVVYRSIGASKDYRELKKKQIEKFLNDYDLINTKKSILEVGCGNGQFLEIFRELNVNCTGIDVGFDNYVKCSNKKLNSGIGNIYDNVSENTIDVLFCFHYLEHIPEAYKFCKRLYDILDKNGLGYIEVPNYDYIEKNGIWVEFTRDHRIYYRKRTLQYLFTKCGFEILDIIDRGIYCTLIVRKPKQKDNFVNMKNKVESDINRFKNLVDSLTGEFVIFGAGHHARLLIHLLYKKYNILPKRIFDSNKQKCGSKICDIKVEHKDEIFKYADFSNIIIICGIYNEEILRMLKNSNINENIIKWE